ncbi:MAG: molybdopterin dinucleotide binding domain-containing protein, partial [Candidatus Acidiferrum sp.]
YFHLRAPVLEPLPGTLIEPEIHRRLVRAIGALKDEDVAPLHAAAAKGRLAFALAFQQLLRLRPELTGLAPVILYETLGPTLGKGNEAIALLWGVAHTCARSYADSIRRAGIQGDGPVLGEALFEAIRGSPSGFAFSLDDYEETWKRLATADGRINLSVAELLDEFAKLRDEKPAADGDFPFVLTAGERRSTTANTIYRDPAWRNKDMHGALFMSPIDAGKLGVAAGQCVRVTTSRGSLEAVVEVTDRMQSGHVSLPNGLGLSHVDEDGKLQVNGVAPNELTASGHRDHIAGTPWHKHVPARVEAVA